MALSVLRNINRSDAATRLVSVLGALLFMVQPLRAQDVADEAPPEPIPIRYRLSLDQDLYYNVVDGPGRNQSNLTEGWNYLTIVNGDLDGEIAGLDMNLSLGIKATDDEAKDVRELSLTNVRGMVSGDRFSLSLGDTFESFSQYSLSSALKGGALRVTPFGARGTELVGVYGIAYPRWDSFLAVGDTDAVRREVQGLRIRQPVMQGRAAVGFSAVRSNDTDPVFPTDTLYDNDVLAVDIEAEIIDGLTLFVEGAYADTTEYAAGTGTEGYEDTAVRIELEGRGGPSRVQLEYERVGSDFWTSAGSAVADREKYKARWRYRAMRDMTLTLSYLFYHDNVDGSRGVRTTHHKPDVGLTWRRFLNRRYGVLDIRYKQDWSENRNRDTLDQYVTIGHRDRFGPVDVDTNLGYSIYDTNDAVRDADEYTYNTTLSSRHTVGDIILKPQLYLGGWTSEDELADETDQIWEDSVGLGLEVPAINLTSNLRVGQHRLITGDGTAADSTRTFGMLNVYYRPEILQRYGRTMLTVEIGYNNLDFNLGDRDYMEFSSLVGLRTEL